MQIRKALVLGMARSGVAAAKLLVSRGAEAYICDRKTKEELGDALDGLNVQGVSWHLGEEHPERLLEGMDALIISPGIPLTNPAAIKAKEMGVEVMGELEYAYRESTGLLMAVTGTNGKTTTCTLLGEMFKNAGKRVSVVGNIGAPFAAAAMDMKAGDSTVCEVSSFQLETIREFHPAISAILNISEDHLNRHGTMENYIALKERIFENQSGGDTVVLNWDDPITRDMAERVKCKVAWFSSRETVSSGAFVVDGTIMFGTKHNARPVCRVEEIFIPGEHNLRNALAASAMAMTAGIPAPVIRHTLRTFKGVEHRIEFTRELSDVKFFNDSKGTNVDSSIQAVKAMKAPTVMILGGYDKHTDFMPLCREIVASGWIRGAVLIGDTAAQIERQLREAGFEQIVHGGYDFPQAIQTAFRMAEEGGNVLFSPSCASFDMFHDYEERGREFKRIVKDLEPKMD